MERFQKLGTHSNAHKGGVWTIDTITSGDRPKIGEFVTGGADGLLRIWRKRTEEDKINDEKAEKEEEEVQPKQDTPLVQVQELKGHVLPIVSVAVSKKSDKPMIASTSLDGTIKLWNTNLENNNPKTVQQVALGETWGIDISEDGKLVVTGGANGVVKVIDGSMAMVDETFYIEQHQAEAKGRSQRESPMVMCVALSNDMKRLAAGSNDGSVTILDVETGKILGGSKTKHGGPVRSISYLPNDPSSFITTSDDCLINIYDAEAGSVTSTFQGHSGFVFSAKASEDGKHIVSGSADQTVKVWDRVMTEAIYTYKGHSGNVWGVRFMDSEQNIVSVSDDAKISMLSCSLGDTTTN